MSYLMPFLAAMLFVAPTTERVDIPLSTEDRVALVLEAVMKALPPDFEKRSVVLDPRWGALPGLDADVPSVQVRHDAGIDRARLSAIRPSGRAVAQCERAGEVFNACSSSAEVVHLTFEEPTIAQNRAEVVVLMSGRLSAESNAAFFQVWKYWLDLGDGMARIFERELMARGHGRIP